MGFAGLAVGFIGLGHGGWDNHVRRKRGDEPFEVTAINDSPGFDETRLGPSPVQIALPIMNSSSKRQTTRRLSPLHNRLIMDHAPVKRSIRAPCRR